ERPLGRGLFADRGWVRAGAALLGAGAVLLMIEMAVTRHVAGRPSWLLGGTPQLGPSGQSFVAVLRRLGFGLFPFGALAFFALAPPLIEDADEAAPDSGRRFAGLLAFFFAAFGLALGTVSVHLVGEPRPVAVLGAALALGAFLDRRLGERRPETVL